MRRQPYLAGIVAAAAAGFCSLANAAVRDTYVFVESTADYAEIAGTPIFAAGWDNGFSNQIDLPFPFVFDGITFTHLFVNPNGFVRLGGTRPSGDFGYSPISARNPNAPSSIAVLALDLEGQDAAASVSWTIVEGPNRRFVVQWKNAQPRDTSTAVTARLNFQLEFEEITHAMHLRYGPQEWLTATAGAAQIGIRGPVGNEPTTDWESLIGATWADRRRGASPFDRVAVGPSSLPTPGTRITIRLPQDEAVVSIGDLQAAEGDANETIFQVPGTVRDPLATALQVRLTTTDARATVLNQDYAPEPGSLFTIPARQTAFTIPIRVRGDLMPEGNEAFTLRIAPVSPATLVSASQSTITILDDDLDCSVVESFSTAVGPSTPPAGWKQVQLLGRAEELWRFDNPGNRNTGMTPPFAVFDSWFFGSNGSREDVALVSPAFDLSDADFVALRLKQQFDPQFNGQGRIEASVDGGATWPITLQDAFGTAIGSPGVPAETLIEAPLLAGSSNVQVRFRWAGSSSQYWAIDDVSLCTGTTPAGIRIVRGEDVVALENIGVANLPLRFDPPTPEELVVGYRFVPVTATAGEDYLATAEGELIVPAGASQANIPIALLDDAAIEAPEEVRLEVTSLSRAWASIDRASFRLTIRNDDAITTAPFLAFDAYNPATGAQWNKVVRSTSFPIGPLAESPYPGDRLWGGGDFRGNDFTRYYAFNNFLSPPFTDHAFTATDTQSGVVTVIGDDGGAIPPTATAMGVAWDRRGRRMLVLWGGITAGIADWRIGEVNLANGVVTEIGPILGLPLDAWLLAPVADPISGEILVMRTSGPDDALLRIDLESRVATPVGSAGVNFATFLGQLAMIDATGELACFLAPAAAGSKNGLYRIDPASGRATFLLDLEAEYNMGQTSSAGFASPIHRLEVVSPFGSPDPPAGVRLYAPGAPVLLDNAAIDESTPGTRRFAVGWTGEGSVPAEGTGNQVEVTLDDPDGGSAIRWIAAVQHELALAVEPPDVARWTTRAGYLDEGEVTLRIDIDPGFRLLSITDDSGAVVATENNAVYRLDAPTTLTARVVPLVAFTGWSIVGGSPSPGREENP